MRLRFSRTTDYGLRAALEVARVADGQLVTRHAIARATDAPASVIAQPLAGLVRAGLLTGHTGPHGGYRLSRRACDISIYDVVLAVQGEKRDERCVLHEGVCLRQEACPFHAVLETAQQRYLDTLRATSLADVLDAGPSARPYGG